jgi:type I restriction enzyme, S subunit
MSKVQELATGSQLPKGYKQTEIGVLPEDWEAGTLDKYWSVIDCKHVTAKFIRNGIPIASIREVQSRFVNLDSANQTTEICYKQLIEGGRKPQCGDLILSRNATVGEVVQVADWHPFFAMGQDVCLLRKRSSNFSTPLLQIIIQSWIVLQQLENCMVGSTFRRVNVEQIKNLTIPLPPTKAEQEAIAHALSDIDALIESLDRLLTKKRQIKQGAMQELLTRKKRLKGFSGEWQSKIFGEIFNYQSTATNSRSDLIEDGDTYYIHYGDIHMRFHSHLDFNYNHPPKINRQLCENATLLQNGDWIMADASEDLDGVGNSVEIIGLDDSISVIAGLHTFVLREKTETFAPRFKGHLGNLKSLHDELLRVATGMKVFGISKTALKELTLPIPPLTEQIEIATILSDMDAEIDSIEAKLTKTRQIKQGMMHELLTGRIRLI